MISNNLEQAIHLLDNFCMDYFKKSKEVEIFTTAFLNSFGTVGVEPNSQGALVFEKIIDHYPKSDKLAINLGDNYSLLANNFEEYQSKLDFYSINNLHLINVDLQKMNKIIDKKQDTDFSEYESSIAEAKLIFEKHKDNIDFSYQYRKGLLNLIGNAQVDSRKNR